MVGKGFYEPVRFSGWPEVKEALASGYLSATFLLAPMAMALRQQGLPIKVVYLGHRDGTAIMVHKDSGIYSLKDLKGKTFAVPNRFSNQYLMVFKALQEQGVSVKDINIREMPPPDMPAALYTKSVDAISSGEPWMAKSEMEGYGRVLYQAKDLWPNFISCVLVVREDVIEKDRAWVEQLVEGIAKSGKWLEEPNERQNNRMQTAETVATKYYNQDPKLLAYVLSKPPDRVTYANLGLSKTDFEKIEKVALDAGILKGSIPFEDYTDTSFSDKLNSGPIEPYKWKKDK